MSYTAAFLHIHKHRDFAGNRLIPISALLYSYPVLFNFVPACRLARL